MVDTGRELSQQSPVSARTPAQIASCIGGGNKQPREHGSVDKPNDVTPAPRLEENNRHDIVRIRGLRNQPRTVPKHTIAMPIEDTPEPFPVAAECQRPVILVRFDLHIQ
jgi:hypothetical protein